MGVTGGLLVSLVSLVLLVSLVPLVTLVSLVTRVTPEVWEVETMNIAIGCDHRGLSFKHYVMGLLVEMGHCCRDCGCYTTDSVDYPDIAQKVGWAVARNNVDRGILICGTGIGMSIAANKIKGIRAALCHDVFGAQRARQHNDANILCLGAERGQEGVREIVDSFLNTKFEGGRHLERLIKIAELEN